MAKLTLRDARKEYIATFKEELTEAVLATSGDVGDVMSSVVVAQNSSDREATVISFDTTSNQQKFEIENKLGTAKILNFVIGVGLTVNRLLLGKKVDDNFTCKAKISITPKTATGGLEPLLFRKVIIEVKDDE